MGKHNQLKKDELIQLYIIENKNQKDIAEIYKCSVALVQRRLKEFNIKKETQNIKESRANTNIKKYGVDNPFKCEIFKDKIKETSLRKYGFKNPIQNKEIKNKAIDSILKKYGTTIPLHNIEIMNKFKKTNLEKYGFENPSQADSSKAKVREKLLQKDRSNLLFELTPKEWAKKYNIPATNLYVWLQGRNNISKDELLFYLNNYKSNLTDIENFIQNNLGYEFWNKKCNPNLEYKPDFKLSDNLYLNVDGLYYHSELYKNNHYHFDMRKMYEQQGLRIFQFRSNEIFNKILIVKSILNNALFKNTNKIGARKTSLQKISQKNAKVFLEQNHIKGYKSAINLGLYYDNELISLMSYKLGKSLKTKQQFIKIERFCSKINLNVLGAFSKMIAYIQQENSSFPIHYWVDLRYGTGDFLLKHGFKLEKETLGWEWTDFENTYNRLRCRANMDERKLSEKEHAVELGLVKIYDAGQRLFIKS